MSDRLDFGEDPPRDAAMNDTFVVELAGYAGPIAALLELAREHKVDLKQVSILELAEQYLQFIQRARQLRLELAADYLVMAAWLAYLKSRLLLPELMGDEVEPSAAEMAAALAFQLQRLQAMQEAGRTLLARPQLGRDFFARGAPEELKRIARVEYEATLYDLLDAYARHSSRIAASRYRVRRLEVYSVEEAIRRLTAMLGEIPEWRSLFAVVPAEWSDGDRRRSAVAATLAASLELVRTGKAELRQDGVFAPIYLRTARGSA
jgi:segregation and condensation protein A